MEEENNTKFDVTMGGGTETCEVVGSFLLPQIQHLDINVGLYRDDGLAISNAPPRDTDNIKKKICRIFSYKGLRIMIEANKQTTNYLDVSPNLSKVTFQPYTKPDTILQYVHRESNHPITTAKATTYTRLHQQTSLITFLCSSDQASCDQATPPYKNALNESAYKYTLHYEPTSNTTRQRINILWYGVTSVDKITTNRSYRDTWIVPSDTHGSSRYVTARFDKLDDLLYGIIPRSTNHNMIGIVSL